MNRQKKKSTLYRKKTDAADAVVPQKVATDAVNLIKKP